MATSRIKSKQDRRADYQRRQERRTRRAINITDIMPLTQAQANRELGVA